MTSIPIERAVAPSSAGASTAASASRPARKPGDFLRDVTGKRVVVRLNSGVEYHGVLACLDGFLNVALEQTEEVVAGKRTAQIGDAFVRGNNVVYIADAA